MLSAYKGTSFLWFIIKRRQKLYRKTCILSSDRPACSQKGSGKHLQTQRGYFENQARLIAKLDVANCQTRRVMFADTTAYVFHRSITLHIIKNV